MSVRSQHTPRHRALSTRPARLRPFGRFLLALGLALLTLPVLAFAAPTADAAAPRTDACDAPVAGIDGFSQNTEQDASGTWVNGDLNRQNSHYAEGDWVPHRVQLKNVAAGPHQVDLTYDILKSGTFAYDHIGSVFVQEGGAATNVVMTETDRPTDASLLASSAAGQTVAVHFTITFDATGSASTLTLRFSAHVASELDWGPGKGASSISGSPYHVSLSTLDCASAGQRDNQMKADAVQGGYLKLVKDVQPGEDPQDFDFTITRVSTQQSRLTHLDDDAASVLPSDETYFLAPGQYTLTESTLAGWTLASITCTGGTATVDLASRTATVTVVDQSRTQNPTPLTCTFVNTKLNGPGGSAGTASKTFDRDWDWTIDKHLADGQPGTRNDVPGGSDHSFDYGVTVTPAGPQDSAWKVSGGFTVTNPNALALTDFTPSASTPGGTCTVSPSGTTSIPAASGGTAGSKAFTYECTFAANPGSGEMTLGGSWTSASSLGSAGSLSITPKPSYDFAGATPTNETDASVTITDNRRPGWSQVVSKHDGPTEISYSWSPDIANQTPGTCADYTNTASLATDDADGDNQSTESDSQEVTVCTGANLAVTKDGNPTMTRTYAWGIEKLVKNANGAYVPSSTQSPVTQTDGGTGTDFAYQVRVTMGSATDSNWQMVGHITVTNPNTWEPVTLTGLTDDPSLGDFGEDCSVTGDPAYPAASDLTIPAGATAHFVYTCQLSEETPGSITSADYTGTNKATATWDAAAADTTAGSASKTINVTAAMWTDDLSEVNKTIEVWDDKTDPEHPVTLGEVTWDHEGGTRDFTYSLTKTAPTGTCATYDNDAWVQTTTEDAGHLADATTTVKACRPTGPSVDKSVTASYERTYEWSIAKSVDHQNDTVTGDEKATFTYGVTVSPNGFDTHSYAMSGTVTVHNNNDFMPITVDITDVPDVGDDASCTVTNGTGVTIPASQDAQRDYTCTFPTDPNAFTPKESPTNVATATWNGIAYDSGATSVTFALTGETNKTVHVTDDQTSGTQGDLGTVEYDDVTAHPEHGYFAYELGLGSPAGTCTPYRNTARITETGQSGVANVQVCSNGDLVVAKSVEASKERTYHWRIDKTVADDEIHVPAGQKAPFDYTVTVGTDGYTDHDYEMTGSIDVTNPNDFGDPITVDVTDVPHVGDGASCDVPDGDGLVVAAATTESVDYTCSFENGYEPGGAMTNTAHVAWNGQDWTDTQAVDFALPSANEHDRTVDVTDDRTTGTQAPIVTSPGDELEYFDVAAHPSHGVFGYSVDLGSEPGTCADHDNTAWITQSEQSADQTVTVCTEQALDIDKTVDASKTRTYGWDIAKSADHEGQPTSVEGSDGTFDYTVDVTQVGYTDSEHAMSGTITVTNPNDFESVTTDVTDVPSVGGGAVCTVADGQGFVLAPAGEDGDSHVFDYTCEFSGDSDPTDGTNTATATWSDPTGADTSVSDTQDATFAITKKVDDQIHVTDSVTGSLGTLTWDDVAGWGSVVRTFHYPLTWSGTPGTCRDFDNTATITETKQSSTATVTLCVVQGLTTAGASDGGYDLTYPWSLDKSVTSGDEGASADGGTFDVGPGQQQPFDYTVTLTPGSPVEDGWYLSGTATVTNTNDFTTVDVDFTGVSTDVTDPGTDCTFVGPTSGTLDKADGAAGAVTSITAHYSCEVTDPDHSGHVTVAYTWDGTPASITTDATLGLAAEHHKTVTVTDTQADSGELGTVTWSSTDPIVYDYSIDHGSSPGECTTHDNTAAIDDEISEVPSLVARAAQVGDGQSDSTEVTVCERAPLGVQQQAAGTYDVTYPWSIAKDASQTTFSTDLGGTVTADYTVTVTPGQATQDGWEVTGQVFVSNPNTFGGDATVGSIVLAGLGDGACALDSTDPVSVPMGGTVAVGYHCTLAEAPADGATVRADVTWADTSSSADATPDFTVDAETDKTIDVVDDQTRPTEAPVELGQVAWNPDGTPTDFTYSVDLGAAGTVGCTTYTNTAQITQTAQSATADVDVCGNPPPEPPTCEETNTCPEPPPGCRSTNDCLPEPPPGCRADHVCVEPPSPAPPPYHGLPQTGAPAGTGMLTAAGGFLVLLGGWLALAGRRRTGRDA